MDEFISLRRDEDHASFTKETFRSLLNTGDYADSTLVDGCNIRTNAHKVILGQQVSSSGATPTSNPNPQPHPMIYLMISNRDMVALLSFPELWEWIFFIPFPFPNFGNRFFHSLPIPQFWECFFSFPSRSRIEGMVFFNSLPVPELREWNYPFLFLLSNSQMSFPLTPAKD